MCHNTTLGQSFGVAFKIFYKTVAGTKLRKIRVMKWASLPHASLENRNTTSTREINNTNMKYLATKLITHAIFGPKRKEDNPVTAHVMDQQRNVGRQCCHKWNGSRNNFRVAFIYFIVFIIWTVWLIYLFYFSIFSFPASANEIHIDATT